MSLPSPPSLQLCEAMEAVKGEPPQELAADIRNVERYVECQRKVFKWVGWYQKLEEGYGKL